MGQSAFREAAANVNRTKPMSAVHYDYDTTPLTDLRERPLSHYTASMRERNPASADSQDRSRTLAISKSRTYDAALTILHAYKLTGDFPTELEIVLRALGVLDNITYRILPKKYLFQSEGVTFWPKPHISDEAFQKILNAISHHIGSDMTRPWWAQFFSSE
jgi:hypothetical protein